MKTLYFVTSNKGKLAEAQEKLQGLPVTLVQHDIGYPEIQAETLEEVVRFGVKTLRQQVEKPFILEDAGIFIDHLKGFPSVYSAYVYYTIGCEGILRLLEGVAADKRTARFKSVYTYSEPGMDEICLFHGECKGRIASSMKGNHGFGYDPIFIPNGEQKTFAQMTQKEKNQRSHRGKALEKLDDFLKKKSAIENFKV